MRFTASRSGLVLGVFIAAVLIISARAGAADAYYSVPISKLTAVEGTIPKEARTDAGALIRAYAAADDPGIECYIAPIPNGSGASIYFHASNSLPEITGTLVLPQSEDKAMDRVRFKAATASFSVDSKQFLRAKLEHYRRLRDQQLPGSAWFRYQARIAAKALGEEPDADRAARPAGVDQDELDELVGLFSGDRAVSENLQLDRTLPPATQPAEEIVKLDTLPTITVSEFDWSTLTKDLKPDVDPLASLIPADQHAIFFPSFEAATRLTDQAQKRGSLFLIAADERSEDAMTQQRYEKQLCLPLTQLGRLIGPQVINSVAITGSDPYLRAGSDVAVLFEAKNVAALSKLLEAQLSLAGIKTISGEVDGIAYAGAVSPDRSICSYRATIGDNVIVTNSLAQLRQIVATQKSGVPALASLPEYLFFRDRYKRGDGSESAFLILSDATLRRWCGPKWRIADSRRTRAQALLSDLQAEHATQNIEGKNADESLSPELTLPQLGKVQLTKSGVVSTTYGSLDFLTPISELDLTEVTKSEAGSYARWRDSYQQNWRWFFDPIACRFSVDNKKLGVDVTVMPLIASTEYREFIKITSGAALKPTSGDPHAGVIGHIALAINPDSDTLKGYGRLMQNLSGNLRIEPLAWLGSCVSLYADDDPFWDELAKAKEPDDFMEKNYQRLPVALYCESRDGLRLAAFLTAGRAFVEQSAPGLTKWENVTHGDKTYVKVTANDNQNGNNNGGNPGTDIYYATTPRALIVSLNETVLQRAMDRQAAATQPSTAPAQKSWLAENIGMRIEPRLVQVIASANREELEQQTQDHAFSNLYILNEWKRLFPDKDPGEVHQRLFGVRLIDPAGGVYSWNDAWRTMQSANYGHPGEPKAGPSIGTGLEHMSGNFGLTFENKGVRARAELEEK